MAVGDPQQQQSQQQQQQQTSQGQLQQQPPPSQGGYYYYQQPTIGQISNNQSAFGFQSNLRSLPGGNPQMSAIQVFTITGAINAKPIHATHATPWCPNIK
uniref:Uncharacterized protein n=1 Tax=Panagrolaimus superbus TaxID=310955 RepID=A0A914YJN4_9BILA